MLQTTIHDRVLKGFEEGLEIASHSALDTLAFNVTPEWTSVGHMMLIAALEAEFDCMLDTDDILAMSTFDKAVEIMARYGD
jgi:acyl carrier protein